MVPWQFVSKNPAKNVICINFDVVAEMFVKCLSL
ncbi:Uncharacterised protein [Shewanella putrefaciens]|nr:Uncharacterised protein [Shewanella putrefaciens]